MAAPPRRSAWPPYLPEELVEEILLRLPPDDPASLLRASLVCKAWTTLLSHRSFRRRFHDLHRTPPLLGFLHDWDKEHLPSFISTTASPFSLAAPDWRSWTAIDCRHGRALFLSQSQAEGAAWELLLWEPTTAAQHRIPAPPAASESEYPTAAVLCAADGCDHRDCLGGPFRVVFVFYIYTWSYTNDEEIRLISACVYSSETGAWGEPALLHNQVANFKYYSSVLVGDSTLYFMTDGETILEYDLATHKLAELDPPDNSFEQKFRLMLAGNGQLLVSESLRDHVNFLSRDPSGSWDVSREIHFGGLLPSAALQDWVRVVGFADGANAIFVTTSAGLFIIDLQSEQARKVCDVLGDCNLIPVVGFYTPHRRP